MELNVKQSGIAQRVLIPGYFKTKAGKVFKRVHERYLRNDISCGLRECAECAGLSNQRPLCVRPNNTNKLVSEKHVVLIDSSAFIRFYDIFESDAFDNVMVCQSVWDHVKSKSIPAYKRLNAWVYEEKSDRVFVFMNDLHHKTYVEQQQEGEAARQSLSLTTSARFLSTHWAHTKPVIVCGDEEVAGKLEKDYAHTTTLKKYIEGMSHPSRQELLDKLAAYEARPEQGAAIYDEHWSHDKVLAGLADGSVKRSTFMVSRENYREATVRIDDENTWFIHGLGCNRAINGDTVAVQLLPREEWSAPEKKLRLRDVEEIGLSTADDGEKDGEEEEGEGEDGEPARKKQRKDVVPTAKVVAIIRRNWRPYCGVLVPSVLKGGRRHLFCPAERLIPRIRIETDQAETLAHQRIVVAVDQWPRDSKYPLGHYVRSLGELGDKETENEVLLLEHDIPHAPFSDAVLDCLPSDDWKPDLENEKHRVDLRHLTICSVDPLGCTDIDDALHCRELPDGNLEVGVHIADVTHFVRPGCAMDEEAANRSTTVYLCDRRIDMLPCLLSSNLCSLRGEEERYAFSVIWTMTKDAQIVNSKFHKSLICSKAALTYEKAQEMIDDKERTDEVTLGLRGLNRLAKLLRARRIGNGALTLASSEIRFEMDWETRTPKGIMEKQCLDTNSMVEEFMLLANIAVAEKILSEYPDCALLRRHPVPAESSYKPLVEAAKHRGLEIRTESGKALADSLDRAVDARNPVLNRLLRMLTTRCMTQAVYFSAGTIPVAQYQHFGLACPIYTHFTSPIRRYADVIVHRLLAACIGADDIGVGLLSQANVGKIATNINYRHKNAQYAGRASVALITLGYFKGRVEEGDGFVMGVRQNGLQVFVPRYGLESIVVVKPGGAAVIDAEAGCVRCGDVTLRELDRVRVRIRLDESNVQRRRIQLELLQPAIPGLSVDFDLSTSVGQE